MVLYHMHTLKNVILLLNLFDRDLKVVKGEQLLCLFTDPGVLLYHYVAMDTYFRLG